MILLYNLGIRFYFFIIYLVSLVNDKAKKFIFSGQNVVIDVVLLNDTIIDLLLYCFHYYPMLIILTSSTLNASFTTTLATKESIYTTTQEDIDLSLRLMVGEILDYDVLHN